MGLKNWLLKKYLKSNIKKSTTDAEQAIDEYLLTGSKQHQDAMRLANKLLKGKMLHQQSAEIINRIHVLDAENNTEEDSLEKTLLPMILPFLLGANKSNQSDTENIIGYDELGNPITSQEKPTPNNSGSPSLADLAKGLSPDAERQIKKKLGIK